MAGETASGSAGTQPDKGYPARRCAKGASAPGSYGCRGLFPAFGHPSHALKILGSGAKPQLFHPRILRKSQNLNATITDGSLIHLVNNFVSRTGRPDRGMTSTGS